MFLHVIKVLSLTGPEGFAAERTMDGYDSVADVTSRLRVVQNRHAQLPTVSIRKKQRAKVTSGDPQEVCRQNLEQTGKVQLRSHAVRNLQQQAQPIVFKP